MIKLAILLGILMIFAIPQSINMESVYGMVDPLFPEELLEESETIFVGNITSKSTVQFEYSAEVMVEDDGTLKPVMQNFTKDVEEYTVSIEEFLKSPQDFDVVTIREPLAGARFDVGDRVILYIPKLDEKNEYRFESFSLPESCDAQDALMQQRLWFTGREFTIMQNGIKFDGYKKKEFQNLTENEPIQLVYAHDMETMYGKSFDIELMISKLDSNGLVQKTVFNQTIKAKSKPCEWIAHEDWEFVPKEGGSYQVTGIAKNIDEHHPIELIIGSIIDVSVSPKGSMSPLQQFKSGIPINKIQCKEELILITKSSDGSPSCVTLETKQKLIERGWTKTVTTLATIPTFDYEIKTGGVTYGSQYQIVGGMVDQITYDESSNSLIISLDAQENGHVQIVLPSGLLSSPTEEAFAKYSVIQDGKEVSFEQLTPILLRIPFEKDTKQISIRGELSEEKSEGDSLILQEGQSWGYIKDISVLDENRIDVTMSYPSNEAHHEIYPDEYQSVIGGCSTQDGSASLSLLYLEGIDPLQNQAKFRKESRVFDGLQCNDAFWEEMTRHGYCGPPHQLISRPEQIVTSIDEANDKLNFTLDVPSYLPDGYSVQKITVDPDGMSAMIYASQKPVTSEMDSCKFMWGDKGIFLFYSKATEEYEWEKRYQEYSKETLEKLVTIDDRIMSAEDRFVGDRFGMPIPQASDVLAYRYEDNVHISIRSNHAVDELVKIAKSFFAS